MYSTLYTIARGNLYEAVRGKIIYIIASLLALAMLLAWFVSQTTLTETREIQVALMAGFLRLSAVFVIIFFVVGSVARETQDKSIDLLFSMALPRYQIFIGKLLGFMMIAILISIAFGLMLIFYAGIYPVLIWCLSLFFELSLVALISLIFILMLENSALSLLLSFAVYLLMRIMPVIQSIGDGPFQETLSNRVINLFVDLVDIILPRLDGFAQSHWLVMGRVGSAEVTTFVVEFMIFMVLFILVGIFDLNKKAL